MKTIVLKDSLGTDIRSRKNARVIKEFILASGNQITIDFQDIVFISRSFADELYNVINDFKTKTIVCANIPDNVNKMMSAVKTSRETARKRIKEQTEIKYFDNIQTLSEILVTTF